MPEGNIVGLAHIWVPTHESLLSPHIGVLWWLVFELDLLTSRAMFFKDVEVNL